MDSTASSAATGPGKRGSFLPRPGASKLPQPGQASGGAPANGNQTITTTTAVKSPSTGRGFGLFHRSSRPTAAPAQPPITANAAVPRTKSFSQAGGFAHRPSVSKGASAAAVPSTRQPLTSAQARSAQQHERQTSGESTSSGKSELNSVNSSTFLDGQSSEESEATPASTPISPQPNGTGLHIPKKSRPSLSDRTIESLANVPPSPATNRRSSSFFSPTSPVNSPRPPSALGSTVPVSRVNYGAAKGNNNNTFKRPASPTKSRAAPTPYTAGQPPVGTPRRSLSTSIARPASALSAQRAPSPTKERRGSSAIPGAGTPASSRPSSRISTASARPPGQKLGLRKPGQTTRSPTVDQIDTAFSSSRPISRTRASTTDVTDGDDKKSSSAALRQQIAQAKAVARNSQRRQEQIQDEMSPATYNFENVEDPFNTKPKDGKDLLRSRIDDARRDGRLNISAMTFSAIPDEVMTMYDAESMESSTVTWSETVDLVRFNAADNDLSELGEKVFPDVSAADMVESEDAKGNQFGGLEHLDLHGNKISGLPIGLRQLTRLTVLNLSRNKLDTALFDIVTRIPTLCDLNVSNNELTHDLPDSIGRLTLLETLDVSNNRITSLPKSLCELSRLRTLSLSHNRLQSLPFTSIAKLPTLRELSASHNAFSGALFPSSVTQLSNLRVLDVSDNAVASLNFAKVLKLPSLVRMDISRNRLGVFPDISEWGSLTTLLADENALSDVPRGMVQLKEKLRTVSLERNSIRDVDEAVADMEGLERLNVAGNPLRERKLLSMDTHDIKREMTKRRELAKEVNGS